MSGDNILILTGDDVLSILNGREIEIMRTVQRAYELIMVITTRS